MTSLQTNAVKAAAVLWLVWGLVHLFAGIIVLTGDPTAGFQAIADAVAPDSLRHNYAPAVGGILNQHGWNLAWFGLATAIGAISLV